MKLKNRPLVILVACVAVALVVVLAAVFFLSTSPGGPTLPIFAGTRIPMSNYMVNFTVSGGVGRLVGAWYAQQASLIAIAWSNYTWPWGPHIRCFNGNWSGTVNVSLVPGRYTMVFGPDDWGMKSGGLFNITETVELVYPGDSPGTNQTLLANWCGP